MVANVSWEKVEKYKETEKLTSTTTMTKSTSFDVDANDTYHFDSVIYEYTDDCFRCVSILSRSETLCPAPTNMFDLCDT